ncbi:MAG: class I SAM-dependent methyltransferase [Desulfobacterales bacterium]|nr:MAG: class I SAM-dependent methyltransferase [Desulfobacterales bacterium]
MNKYSDNRNIRAHKKLNKIGFPHRIINLIVFEKVRDCLKKIPNINHIRPRLLDVGCGTGYLLQKMLAQGLDAWGLDPYPRIETARESVSKRVIAGSIEDVPDETFQIITAVEVLEHVENYMKLLESMKELLSPNGFIIITVPNKWEFRAKYSTDGATEPMYGHLWQFDHKSLESDLKCFSNEVYIEPIYSRTLDRRLLKIIQIFPTKATIKLSRALVKYYRDGAWLMGIVGIDQSLSKTNTNKITLHPSAKYYRDSPFFQKRTN